MILVTETTIHYEGWENELVLVNPSTIIEIRPVTEHSYFDRARQGTEEDIRLLDDEGEYITSAQSVIIRSGDLGEIYIRESVKQIHDQIKAANVGKR